MFSSNPDYKLARKLVPERASISDDEKEKLLELFDIGEHLSNEDRSGEVRETLKKHIKYEVD